MTINTKRSHDAEDSFQETSSSQNSRIKAKRRLCSMSMLMTICLVLVSLFLPSALACNEAVCASIVSKCTLLRSCECEIIPGQECTCCDRCSKCLDYALGECCSCFGLCPKPDVTQLTAHESTVFDFPRPTPELWEALTGGAENSHPDQWDRVVYPVDIPPTVVKGKEQAEMEREREESEQQEEDVSEQSSYQEVDSLVASHVKPTLLAKEDLVTVNCSVVYLRECISASKCKNHCNTMGATSGRWFEDGCCQCIGHNCGVGGYGINESRCGACGLGGEGSDDAEDDDLEELSDEELLQLEEQYESDLYSDQ